MGPEAVWRLAGFDAAKRTFEPWWTRQYAPAAVRWLAAGFHVHHSMLFLLAAAISAAPLGDWDGALTAPSGIQVPLVLHLRASGSTIDSPDQNASGIPIEVVVLPSGVTITMPSSKAEFDGALSADGQTLAGPFMQGGMTMQAHFAKRAPGTAPVTRNRPQTPKPPFPYTARDVTFADGPVILAGTVTMPRGSGPFPAVVLIAGSGPQDRNETVEGHRIFFVIADRLTRAGIAVLRYDKRGVGKSGGSYGNATQKDFAADAESAVEWLRAQPGIDPTKVGLLGHSEGAEIAPIVANADRRVAFTVLLSGPAENGVETIALQAQAIALASGVPKDKAAADNMLERKLLSAVAAAPDPVAAKTVAFRILLDAGHPAERAATEAKAMASPWYRAFLNEDPLPALRKLSVPTLVIAGSRDLQVLPERSLPLIRAALAGKPFVEIDEFSGLNHFLQPATTGTPAEYGQIETTIAPQALDRIVSWVTSIVH